MRTGRPRAAGLSASRIVEALSAEVRAFRAGKSPEDDVSIAAIRFQGAGA